VTIDDLVDLAMEVAQKQLTKRYDVSKPQGVRGRNSDNTKLRQVLGWEPQIPLKEGLVPTYGWIHQELEKAGRIPELVGQQSNSVRPVPSPSQDSRASADRPVRRVLNEQVG
jgi:dTDP-D-glucose 4,6-dehydratase